MHYSGQHAIRSRSRHRYYSLVQTLILVYSTAPYSKHVLVSLYLKSLSISYPTHSSTIGAESVITHHEFDPLPVPTRTHFRQEVISRNPVTSTTKYSNTIDFEEETGSRCIFERFFYQLRVSKCHFRCLLSKTLVLLMPPSAPNSYLVWSILLTLLTRRAQSSYRGCLPYPTGHHDST